MALKPVLGLLAAGAIVVGEVIGSGIFLSPRQVAASIGDRVWLILALWIVAGIVNLCGALTLAELGAMLPHAGGTYVFLREAYGKLWAFLWTWAEFWVVRSGSIAVLSVALTMSLLPLMEDAGYFRDAATTLSEDHLQKVVAEQTEQLKQLNAMGGNDDSASQETLSRLQADLEMHERALAGVRQSKERTQIAVAVGCIILLTIINVAGVRWGGIVQVVTTLVKAAFVAFLAILPLLALRTAAPQASLTPPPGGADLLRGIGSALALIMFAYDGWGNVTLVAEEIRDPQRNLPRALALGLILLIVLYTGANLAYHHTLSTTELSQVQVPAVAVADRLLPNIGKQLTLSMMMISVFGALNGNILCGPRALYAVGRDHTRLRWLARLDPRTGTPALATVALSLWSVVLILLGGYSPEPGKRLYELLVDYTIFGGSMFYFAAVVAVFVLRARRPDLPRPYRTWGYPYLPAIFCAFYVFLLGTMLYANTKEALVGLSLIAAGIVAYLFLRDRSPT
ncbi:MAG: APC family permease [Pirellulales bacterium]